MSSSLVKPGTAPAEMTRACMLYTAATQCSHACAWMGWCAAVVLRACRKHCACCITCCPCVLTFAVNSSPLFTSPFPSPYTLDILHESRTCSVSEMPWQCWICCTQSPQHVHTNFWLGTMDRSMQVQTGWLLWCLVNLGVTHSPQCLKLTPSSFKFSSKFSSLVLLLAIQVAKWWMAMQLSIAQWLGGSG